MLKDKGSWSYDWREPLRVLEEHCTYDPSYGKTPSLNKEEFSKRWIPRNIRADKIGRPPVWTKVSFHDYVVRLAFSTVDRLVAPQIYQDGEAHSDAVADILERVFADPIPKYVISINASNVALGFFYRVGKLARARDLFSRLQELQKNISPLTYNIMLGAAADEKDLFTFTSILKMMVSHRVRPNLRTWLHLARAVREEEVQMTILEKLYEKPAMRHPAIIKEAAALIMPHVASKHLTSGNDPKSLLDELDNNFGPEWFSVSACQRIIDEVGVRHSTPQALIILKELCDRGYKPTQAMLVLLLRQCSWRKAHELAIEVLRLFRVDYATQPSRQIYDVLFEQAWKSRLYNCCRVLWIHACVRGHASFDMQEKIKKSLYVERRSKESATRSRASFWEETAGKVIAGFDRFYKHTDFWELMSTWKPAQESLKDRDKFLRAVRSLLDNDRAIAGQYSIPKPLDELLSEALTRDRSWALGRALKEIPAECKYSQVMDVGLVRKTPLELAHNQTPSSRFSTKTDQLTSSEEQEARSHCCWMSSEMRSSPCICPDYVKQGLHALPHARAIGQNGQVEPPEVSPFPTYPGSVKEDLRTP
ncbi:MAG: hypothetical protein LQ338_007007 [Usnochroma carphineum]|nr:MAG: hypothetical protein LQ338_007007 [Usnochroma carphineum]